MEKMIRVKLAEEIAFKEKDKISHLKFPDNREKVMSFFRSKIMEEAIEVIDANNKENLIEEICDLIQVLKDYAFVNDICFSDVTANEVIKLSKKGGFIESISGGYSIAVLDK